MTGEITKTIDSLPVPHENEPRRRAEPCPLQWDEEDGSGEHVLVESKTAKDGSAASVELFRKHLTEIVGVSDWRLALDVIEDGAQTLKHFVGDSVRAKNKIMRAVWDHQPANALEARLVIQQLVAQTFGLKAVSRTVSGDAPFTDTNQNVNSAAKLLRVSNETAIALDKIKRGGVQKVIVHHQNVVAKNATVNNVTGAGAFYQTGGGSPCQRNVGPEQEPINIDPVDSQQWQTEGVDCTVD